MVIIIRWRCQSIHFSAFNKLFCSFILFISSFFSEQFNSFPLLIAVSSEMFHMFWKLFLPYHCGLLFIFFLSQLSRKVWIPVVWLLFFCCVKHQCLLGIIAFCTVIYSLFFIISIVITYCSACVSNMNMSLSSKHLSTVHALCVVQNNTQHFSHISLFCSIFLCAQFASAPFLLMISLTCASVCVFMKQRLYIAF